MNILALQDAVAPHWFDYDLNQPDMLGGWLVCFLTLAVFSFLYKDNPFYKFAEHVFVGVGTAWFTMEYYDKGIKKPLFDYLKKAEEAAALKAQAAASGLTGSQLDPFNVEIGGYDVDPTYAIVWRTAALVLGLFILVRLFKSDSWMPRWPLAIMVGVYAALKMTGEVQSKFVILVAETMKNPFRDASLPGAPDRLFADMAGQVVLLLGLVCALTYFLFTFQRNKVVHGMARVGVIVLMVTFGSMFGFTVLGRIALLIDRVSDLEGYTAPGFSILDAERIDIETPGWQTTLVQSVTPPFIATAVILLGLILLARRSSAESPKR